jgi:Holliday junction DNA helicase RuvA
MYEYIEGKLIEKNPTYCIVETGGIGYFIQITLTTFSLLNSGNAVKLFLHQVVREDAHLLFGFNTKAEREMFRLLLTVSGVGANTARMMLSSLTSDDIQQAILGGNIAVLQSIKGIGAKTAQRIIIDLRDKISKEKLSVELFPMQDNRLKDEALSALVILGFNKGEADKVIGKILLANRNLSLEDLIKKALKEL